MVVELSSPFFFTESTTSTVSTRMALMVHRVAFELETTDWRSKLSKSSASKIFRLLLDIIALKLAGFIARIRDGTENISQK